MSAKLQLAIIAVLALAAVFLFRTRFQAEETYVSGAELGFTPESTSADGFAEGSASADSMPTAVPTLIPSTLSEGLFHTGHWRGQPVIEDLNGDGHQDVVAAIRRWDKGHLGDGLFVWLGDGTGRWTQSIDGLPRDMGYGGASVLDIDGNGSLDIAYSSHDTMPRAFLGDGEGAWSDQSLGIETTGPCADVALGDWDGDGAVEMATMGFFSPEGGLRLFEWDGTLWNFEAELLDQEIYGANVTAEDLDGDGAPELLAATSVGTKIWRFEDGEAVDWSEGLPEPSIGGSELAVAAWDLDGDGTKELMLGGMAYEGHDPLRCFRWNGREWEPWGSGLPGKEAFFDVDFCQLDGVGHPELVASGKHGISVISMPEVGRFEHTGRIESTQGVLNAGTGDVDGDGQDEILYIGFFGLAVLDLGGLQ